MRRRHHVAAVGEQRSVCAPLAALEKMAQEVAEYATVHATLKRLGVKIRFEGLHTTVASFLESAHFTFAEFNSRVRTVLSDADDGLLFDGTGRIYFDGDGRGPYSRSPV